MYVDCIVWDVESIICTARQPGKISAFLRTAPRDRLLFLAPLTVVAVHYLWPVSLWAISIHPARKGVSFIMAIRGSIYPRCHGERERRRKPLSAKRANEHFQNRLIEGALESRDPSGNNTSPASLGLAPAFCGDFAEDEGFV